MDRIKDLEYLADMDKLDVSQDVALARYTDNARKYRKVSAPPEVIAQAAHLYYIKGVPGIHIVECGLITQSKFYAILKWSKTHLMDYCRVNDVTDIYTNGLPEARFAELAPNSEIVKHYLDNFGTQGL